MTEDNCRVYACVNQKGGVGKSVTSTNLGIGLARNGEKVLIVDLDSQASQTVSLGWKEPDELLETIATQLTRVMENKPFDPRDGILSHAEGVFLMPSSIALSGVEMRLVNAMSRELTLKKYLAAMRPDYDAIVLDCPPTLGMMTINALAAADSVIVPVQPEYLSVIGMTQLFETIGLVKENINPNLRVEGALITLANMRTNLAKNTVEIIKGAYGGNVRVYPEPMNGWGMLESNVFPGIALNSYTGKKVYYDLSGAVFEIRNSGGTLVDTLTTDAQGKAQSKSLKLGSYTVTEKSAPYGYVRNTNTFTAKLEYGDQTASIVYTTTRVPERPQTGIIRVSKNNANNNMGDYALNGAVFEVRANQDIKRLDGTMIYSKGGLADTITTDAKGEAQTKELPLGAYTVTEKTAPYGYVLNTNSYTATLNYGGQEVSIVYNSVTVPEQPQVGTITITKLDKTTGARAQGDSTLNGAVFENHARL